MKTMFGVFLILFGICLGLYLGVWWAFIGGIVQIIEQVRAPELEAIQVAYGVCKIVFAGAIGFLPATFLIWIGKEII